MEPYTINGIVPYEIDDENENTIHTNSFTDVNIVPVPVPVPLKPHQPTTVVLILGCTHSYNAC